VANPSRHPLLRFPHFNNQLMSFANFDYEAQTLTPREVVKAATATPQTEPQNELDGIIDKTSKQLELFGALVSQFDIQRKQVGTRRDNARLRANIDVLISKIANMESAIRILIDNVASVVNNNQAGGTHKRLNITKKQIVIKERLESEFNGLHKQLQVTTRAYREKKKQNPLREANETTPLIEEHNQQQVQLQQQHQQQQQIQEEQINETELQYHLLLTEERNQEINQINEGILEINSIFKDLGELVHQQGDQLDTIEENVLQLSGHTQQAQTELVKANEYQRKKGKWSCIILVALCIVGLVIVLAVVS
jgi:t-SNARE complex subunit (syntaxin)